MKYELKVESNKTHKGLKYLVVFSDMGHRCGYVEMPDFMLPASDWTYDKVHDLIKENPPHGGVTYLDKLSHILGECNTETYIGFDSAHYGDAIDCDCIIEYFGEVNKVAELRLLKMHIPGTTIKVKEYMADECISLIDNLLLKGENNKNIDKHLDEGIDLRNNNE